MMGPEKLSSIRAKVRKSFEMSDADLLAWFNRQIEDVERTPSEIRSEIDTLRLLRDALVEEVKHQEPERAAPPEK